MTKPDVKLLPNRTFGLIFSAIFAAIALYTLLFDNGLPLWLMVIATVFFVTAVLVPDLLLPLNKLWMRFGLLMHSVINPILMGLISFLTVVPTGVILKLGGKDPMNRKIEHHTKTYWIARNQDISIEFFDSQF